MMECVLCGCSDDSPCVGGVLFTSTAEAEHIHRLVDDEELLEDGEACRWIAEHVCSAHSADELATLDRGDAGAGESLGLE